MLLHDDAVADAKDRYFIERFAQSAHVVGKKLNLYAELAQRQQAQRHFKKMAAQNQRAEEQLKQVLARIPEV